MSLKQPTIITREDEWILERSINDTGRYEYYKTIHRKNKKKVAQLFYELELSKKLSIDSMLQPQKIIDENDHLKLSYSEQDNFETLENYMSSPLNTYKFLKIAINVTNAFIELQQGSYVYRNVHPKHILINSKTYDIKLFNFEYAFEYADYFVNVKSTQDLPLHRVQYAAPEESGRVNGEIDSQTDLFSIGCLFYFMLTSHHPYEGKGIEYIHTMLTTKPKSMQIYHNDIPSILEKIVLKCMSKNKEDRYQSAIGLKEDLLQCWYRVTNNLPLYEFTLGSLDFAGKPRLSSVIPARTQMSQRLVQTITQNKLDSVKLHIIVGPKESGKTKFLKVLHDELLGTNSFLLQFSQNTKHAQTKIPVVLLAFRRYLQKLHSLDQQTLDYWKQQVGTMQLLLPLQILDILPELKIFEQQLRISKEVTVIDQDELFHMLLHICDLFQKQQQIIFLVDDWEMLDEVTRRFIQYVIQKQKPYFVIVTGNEQSTICHNLQSLEQSVEIEYLQYLEVEQIHEWLHTSFTFESTSCTECAAFLFDVTNGKAQLIEEVFNALCEKQFLKFHATNHYWYVEWNNIEAHDTISLITEFLQSALQQLHADELLVLQYAACFGEQFQLEGLLNVVPLSPQQFITAFKQLMNKRVFIVNPEQFTLLEAMLELNLMGEIPITAQFINEQIHQRAMQLISPQDSCRIHKEIAHYLQHEHRFTNEHKHIVWHHLQYALSDLSATELNSFLNLSVELGKSCLNFGMFEEVLMYSTYAFDYMPEDYWQDAYDLALQIHILYANALYLNDRLEAEQLFEELLGRAKSDYDRLYVMNEKVLFFSMKHADISGQQNIAQIYNQINEVLKPYHISLKLNANQVDILKEYVLLQVQLKKCPPQKLLHLPAMKNKEIELLLKLLMYVSGTALIINGNLFAWLVMRAIRLMIKHGNVDFASLFYSNYANILIQTSKNYKQGLVFGELAIQHVEKYNNTSCKCNVYMNYGMSIAFLKMPYDRVCYYLMQSQQYSFNNKLHRLFNSMTASQMLHYMNLQGTSIQKILEEFEDQKINLTDSNNVIGFEYAEEMIYWLQLVQKGIDKPKWDRDVTVKTLTSNWDGHLLWRLQMSYLLGETERSLVLIDQLEHHIPQTFMLSNRPQFYFYKALVIHRQAMSNPHMNQRMSNVKQIRTQIKKLELYEESSPQNFEHMKVLIQALYFDISKQPKKATLYFDRAIQLAKHSNNLRDTAIAELNASLFYERLKDGEKAQDYLQRAIETLYAWQAPALAEHWSRQYRALLKWQLAIDSPSQTERFNIAPIVNMYQTIAHESTIEALLEQSMFEMQKQLDAEKLSFWKVDNQELTLQATVTGPTKQFHYFTSNDQQVLQPHEQQLLKAAISKQTYEIGQGDHWVGKSALCVPIFNKGKIAACIYATNETIASLFTKMKIDTVTILGTQLLVAVENIERQIELEQQVAKRTSELSDANEQLSQMNRRLRQNEEERKYFLQHISHDLRSPITSVLGYVEALSCGLVKSEQQQIQYLERSKIRLHALNHLIQDLFDMSLLEGDRLEFQKHYISVEQLFVMIDHTLQTDLDDLEVKVLSRFNCEYENLQVFIDNDRILQVIRNVTSNIRKYANTGHVHFVMIEKDHKIVITIRDEGIGIPQKDLPFVFDMHFKASNNDKREAHGIGLAICKQIIEHHDGRIAILSGQSEGTTVQIELPVASQNS